MQRVRGVPVESAQAFREKAAALLAEAEGDGVAVVSACMALLGNRFGVDANT
jgi:hypothetical protein